MLVHASRDTSASPAVGTLNVKIQEYEVPTPKSRPHDPAVAPDGSLWYTGQGANKIGRLDPKTGEFKEYRVEDAKLRAARAGRRQGWQHLVHRDFRRLCGQAESKDGRDCRVSPARMARRSIRTLRVRPRWHFVVYQRRNQLHRATRSENRQDDAGQSAYAARGALRNCDLAEQYAFLLRIRHEQAGQH